MSKASSPANPRETAPPPSPEHLWRVFAPAIAGRERIRVRTDRGRYRDGGPLRAETLPVAPAAVLIFDKRAQARCLVLDLDSKVLGTQQALLDSLHAVELASRAGLSVFIDESPNGGRHVYLPLQDPISADAALAAATALRLVLPSLDVAPLSNPATGAIRPPGSAHPSGGHQALVTSLADAAGAVLIPGSPTAWACFLRLLPHSPAAGARRARGSSSLSVSTGTGARPALDPYNAILRMGLYDATRYPTPSEARFAALCHLLRRGWSERDIALAAVDGRFPGLLSLFTKHSSPLRALSGELNRASEKLSGALDRPRDRNNHTRDLPTPPASSPPAETVTERGSDAEYGFVRSWWTAARHEGWMLAGTTALVDRSVLQALGALAQMLGTRYVDVGTRTLGQAACLDHSTVARSLKRLAGTRDSLIVLLQASGDTDGMQGDLYELVVPPTHAAKALGDPWARGLIERLHPAFWMLSKSSRYAWQALGPLPCSTSDLQRAAGLAKETFRGALAELAAHGLARHTAQGWQRGYTTLNQVAARTGGDLRALEVEQRHLDERRAWRALKGLPAPVPDRAAQCHQPAPPMHAQGFWADGTPIGPEWLDDELKTEQSALALLSSMLGAVVIYEREAG
jgi:hypothetical protein